MIELVTGVVTDADSRLLLARSKNHDWWELPGTKIKSELDDREELLSAALANKLGLVVASTEAALPRLTTIAETIAGVTFIADVRHVTTYEGHAMETAASGYSELEWVNPSLRRLGSMGLSPVTQQFLKPFQEDPLWLQHHENTD